VSTIGKLIDKTVSTERSAIITHYRVSIKRFIYFHPQKTLMKQDYQLTILLFVALLAIVGALSLYGAQYPDTITGQVFATLGGLNP
jgi:hypothetical protein